MDFTLKKYILLLDAFKEAGYRFVTFCFYCDHKSELSTSRYVILRHDVDLKVENSLNVARIEHEHGINASYYFRVVEQSNNMVLMRLIISVSLSRATNLKSSRPSQRWGMKLGIITRI